VNPELPILELVVARHVEDLAWLGRVPENFRITVYDKGDGSSGGMRLTNMGREAHTYLHHLSERHESLAALTVFVQGHPFDHAPDLHKTLRALAAGTLTMTNFHWLGFLAETDDPRGAAFSSRGARTRIAVNCNSTASTKNYLARQAPLTIAFSSVPNSP
jgi:Protein of unknown function (DUF3431).